MCPKKLTRKSAWRWSVGFRSAAYVLGFPVAWYVATMLLYHAVWSLHLLPENPSGLPTILGADLAFYLCGPGPLAWIAIIVLAADRKLPGLRHNPDNDFGRCEWCGYPLARLAPPGTSIPCPECGELVRVPVARGFEPICPPGTVPGGEPPHYADDRLRQG
jgi:hypothetical protein